MRATVNECLRRNKSEFFDKKKSILAGV
jgi:hypothetical protein